jgi:hypothetical protein
VARLDGARLLVNRHNAQFAPFTIWMVNARPNESAPLTRDTSDCSGISTAADGQTATATRAEWRSGVWMSASSGASSVALARESSAGAMRWLSLDRLGHLAVATQFGDERSIRLLPMHGAGLAQVTTRGLASP